MSIVQILMCICVSTGISAGATFLLIPFLRKLNAGQSIREEGPQSHLSKAGTPTMGGVAIIFTVLLSSALFVPINAGLLLMVSAFLLFAGIGFIDDFF